jgi:flagellar hook assembly protein FlgD
LYDIQGRLVTTLVNEEKPAGLHQAVWNARNNDGGPLPSGVYFCHLVASGFRMIEKVVLID